MDHVTGLKKPEQERYGRWKVAVFLNADRSGDAVRLRKGKFDLSACIAPDSIKKQPVEK